MGLFGPPDVTRLKAKRDVPGLIKALGYEKDAEIRRRAAEALGALGDPGAMEPLVAMLGDAESAVRASAAGALGAIGDPRALPPLVTALENVHYSVRVAAATALRSIGDPRAAEPLIMALARCDTSIWPIAASALDSFGWTPDQGPAGAAYWAERREWQRCIEIGPPAVDALVATLRHRDKKVQLASAEALGAIGDPRAVAALMGVLKWPDDKVRWACRDALVRIGAPAIAALIAALADANWQVRMTAAHALANMEWAPDDGPAGAAFWAVREQWDRCVEIGGPAVDPLLLAVGHPHMSTRRHAATALAYLYSSGRLDAEHRQRIISRAHAITLGHQDVTQSSDCSGHDDSPAIVLENPA